LVVQEVARQVYVNFKEQTFDGIIVRNLVYWTSLELRQLNAQFLYITYVYHLVGVIEKCLICENARNGIFKTLMVYLTLQQWIKIRVY